jgi:hypothetical protein
VWSAEAEGLHAWHERVSASEAGAAQDAEDMDCEVNPAAATPAASGATAAIPAAPTIEPGRDGEDTVVS